MNMDIGVSPYRPPTEWVISTSDADFLNKILRGEIAAIEAYNAVIQKFPRDAKRFSLRDFEIDHNLNVAALRVFLKQEGEPISESSGPWGTVVTGLVSLANFAGDTSAVSLLIAGEEHGLKLYEEALTLNLNDEIKKKIKDVFIPRSQKHISSLKTAVEVM